MRSRPGSKVKAKDRIFYLRHKAINELLIGRGLKSLTDRFETNLHHQVSDDKIGREWQDLPDLHCFVRNKIFRALLESMCGPYLLSLNPTFADDFWEFDGYVVDLFKFLPRFMMPQAFSARERCFQAVRKWHRFAIVYRNENSIEIEDDFHPVFGAKQSREIRDNLSKMEHMDADGVASAEFGLIWA